MQQSAEKSTASTEPQLICQIHNKEMQGYCLNDRQILCIDCILTGEHKNHEISAIDKSAKIERDNLTIKYQQSKVLQDLLQNNQNKNISH